MYKRSRVSVLYDTLTLIMTVFGPVSVSYNKLKELECCYTCVISKCLSTLVVPDFLEYVERYVWRIAIINW